MSSLLLVGSGNIGGALLDIWTQTKLFDNITVIQPSMSLAKSFEKHSYIRFIQNLDLLPDDFSPTITVLAIKPQLFDQVASKLEKICFSSILISLLASITTEQIVSHIGDEAKVIRMMTNVGIRIGKSINISFANKNTNSYDINFINKIGSGEL